MSVWKKPTTTKLKMKPKDFILASGSQDRLRLLAQIGYEPKLVDPADIDETRRPHERPLPYVRRMAREKALKMAQKYPCENVLAGDTVVTVGLRIIQKSKSADEQNEVMHLISGRNHKVISAVCLVDKSGKLTERYVSTRITMKALNEEEIGTYLKSKEWVGVCGYRIDGILGGYVKTMVGSYSGVIGLPLFETRNLLIGAGIK